MNATINTGSIELTVGQLGEQAAHVVRARNHLTLPTSALADPIEVDQDRVERCGRSGGVSGSRATATARSTRSS
jgi:hypothetical protein